MRILHRNQLGQQQLRQVLATDSRRSPRSIKVGDGRPEGRCRDREKRGRETKNNRGDWTH